MTSEGPARPAPQESTNLLGILSSARNDSKYADLEIHCQDKVFKVHKVIVCTQSDFLSACVNLPFQESQTGIIKLDDEIPEIVGYFIDFLYTENYKVLQEVDGEPRSATTNSELLVHSHVYTIADKFLVPALKKLAADNFKVELTKLKSDNLEVFVPLLKVVFEGSSPDDMTLKDICTETTVKFYSRLSNREDFKAYCKENGEVCFEILQAVQKCGTLNLNKQWAKKNRANENWENENGAEEPLSILPSRKRPAPPASSAGSVSTAHPAKFRQNMNMYLR